MRAEKKNAQEQFILEKLKVDINSDVKAISYEMKLIKRSINQLTISTDAILGKTEPTREDFIKNLNSLLMVPSFDQNRTAFNNIVSSGQIEYIQNQALTDSITKYYNYDYKGWDTALRDYTRNIMAPFMLNFDHIPQANLGLKGYENLTKFDINQSKIPPKTLDDYRSEVFFLNILRQKIWNMEGQEMQYQNLKKNMFQLRNQIDAELNNR